MRISLRRVLQHPSLTPALPQVLTGRDRLRDPVRWIHSSEVLEIAPLLRGGELLLTGGTVLAESSPSEQRRYVRELAERGVAGVAIETGGGLPVVPSGVLEEAARLSFPVIELRRVVPFVEVAEAINGELVDASVTNLRYVAELTHALSGVVVDGGGVREILEELVARTGIGAVLYDSAGRVMESVGIAPPASEGSTAGGISTSVTIRGVHVATLWIDTSVRADDRMAPAADTAAQSLSLALLRTRPLSARELAARELVRLAGAGRNDARQLQAVGRTIDFRPADPVIGVAAVGPGVGAALPRLDALLHRFGGVALDAPAKSEVHAVVSLKERGSAAATRTSMLDALREWIDGQAELVIVVGPVVPALAGAPLSLNAVSEILALQGTRAHERVVIDSHTRLVDRLVEADQQHECLGRLADEELAMFDLLPSRPRDVLLETLKAYLDSGCHKSATAGQLHVTRQALYGRLQRAFSLLGGDPTGTDRAFGLQLALRIRHLR
ncbi:MAG: PucR family transcriptional regulator [Nocardioidaceae bacterium]